MKSGSKRWSVILIGGVVVRGSDGQMVRLPTRKVAGLLAVLVVAEGRTLDRRWIEEILWPASPAKQRAQSLRNALTALRQIFRDDGLLEVGVATCRVRPELFESDYPPANPSDWVRLAPEMEGEWFARLRERRPIRAQVASGNEAVGASFAHVLAWAADADPYRAVDLMKAVPELTATLPPKELESLSSRLLPGIQSTVPQYGWLLHFRGVARYLQGDVRDGLRSLADAGRFATARRDALLLGESVRWQVAPYLALGDAEGAARQVDKGLALAVSANEKEPVALLSHAQGIAYYHLCRYAEGEEALNRALSSDYYRRDLTARVQLLGNATLLRAMNGDVRGARAASEEAYELLPDHPHPRVDAACSLSAALLHLKARNLDAAEIDFSRLLKSSGSRNFTTIDILAKESSVHLWIQRGDLPEAKRQFREAVQLRRTINLGITRWDQVRLQATLKSLRSPAS